MKYSIQIAIVIGCVLLTFSCVAQKGMENYEMNDGTVVNSGDTIVFTGGSLGGQYVNVFFMVGNLQKRKANFNDVFHSQLIIDHFLERKEDGEIKVFAVMEVPNQPKWHVWARLEEALKTSEITIK
tara:strand:- start:102 stop:479 length:378 start_codon:yes stop_codon:yes gene_type:complete